MRFFSSLFHATTSRSRPLSILLVAVMGIFVLRLFYVQVIRHDFYVDEANASQITKLTIQPERGEIYATDGTSLAPLALNQPVYTVFADPTQVQDASAITNTVKQVAGGNSVDDSFPLLTSKSLQYVVLAKQITQAQAQMIQKANLAGVGLQKNTQRIYPEGTLAAQLLGYVNTDGKGQYGIEEYLDDRLKGTAGLLQSVTDVRKIPLTVGKNDIRKPAKDGDNLVLNIDSNIQSQAEQYLKEGLAKVKATKGSVIVMDPNNGAVLAMANVPTYDPAHYNDVKDYSVFQNSAVSAPYEAGSVIKTLTMGAGLDSGAIGPNSTYNNTGSITVDGIKISNVEEDPIFPNTSMTDVLEYSLNTGVVYVLQQMGGGQVNEAARQKLYTYFADHYRFGKKTGIEQAGETPGTIIGPDEGYGLNIRYANMAFGQGMDVTLIQTLSAFAAVINGGTYYQPELVKGVLQSSGSVTPNAPKVLQTNVLTAQHSSELRDMIWQARQKGFFGNVDPDGYKVGGKTGTSQIIDPKTGAYINANSIGSYLGFGGTDAPRYVIMVKVDDSQAAGYAGTTAAGPIFNNLSNWMINYLELRPSN